MRTKEMPMDDYKVMYAEYCMVWAYAGAAPAPGASESFTEFVAWRKRVEKYFDNNEDSS